MKMYLVVHNLKNYVYPIFTYKITISSYRHSLTNTKDIKDDAIKYRVIKTVYDFL